MDGDLAVLLFSLTAAGVFCLCVAWAGSVPENEEERRKALVEKIRKLKACGHEPKYEMQRLADMDGIRFNAEYYFAVHVEGGKPVPDALNTGGLTALRAYYEVFSPKRPADPDAD